MSRRGSIAATWITCKLTPLANFESKTVIILFYSIHSFYYVQAGNIPLHFQPYGWMRASVDAGLVFYLGDCQGGIPPSLVFISPLDLNF